MDQDAVERRSDDFVPMGFADLRRDTPQDRALLDAARNAGPRDIADLIADREFMARSRWIGFGAMAIAIALLLAAERGPILDAFDTVRTAAAATPGGVGAATDDLHGLAARAVAIETTEAKAVGTARKGLACLGGTGACPNGERSPLQ